jgi:hypothetical protein
LVLQDRLINGSIDSPLEPQPAPSFDHDQLIRVRIQTRWRATTTATTTAKAKTLIRKNIDISDLLIQTAIRSKTEDLIPVRVVGLFVAADEVGRFLLN